MNAVLGVGVLGAGPVTQAIHLPTLARLAERFRVVSVMDVDAKVATEVARRANARAKTSVEEVLTDPEVDVVAICSPPQFHAEQVQAICAAGKRGILCEKPLATSRAEATTIADAVATSRTPMVIGAMHAYDPGWSAALEECRERFGEVHTIRSTIVLPFNDRFEDWATEVATRAEQPPRSGPLDDATRVAMMRGLVLGLSIHDLPLIRTIAPDLTEVEHAAVIEPFGGVLALRGGGRRCDLVAFMRPIWEPDWRLEAMADDWSLTVRFTPSYVHAGSATVHIRSAGGEQCIGPWPSNGYEGEWIELHAQVVGDAPPRHDLDSVLADLTFATDIADRASALVLQEAS